MKVAGNLLALVLILTVFGCSSEKDDGENAASPDPGSADGQPQAVIPEGFNVLTPNYLGLKENPPDSGLLSKEFLEQQCEGKTTGDFFSYRYGNEGYDELHFCLGPFTRPEQDNRENVCVDCRSKVELQNLYIGIVTDKGPNGVADVSFIVITETPDLVRTECDSSNFNSDGLRASYGNSAVSKSVLEQMLSLQTTDGVCSNVRLADYRQLQHVTMEDWDNRKAEFALTAVTLEGR